jgi:hypothetical protein
MNDPASAKSDGSGWRIARIGASIVVLTLIAGYAGSIVSGRLEKGRQIDGTGLAVIVLGAALVAMLLDPGFLGRLSRVEWAGFKVELLKRVQEKQSQQESQLNDMQLLLPLLLPATERRHLRNLLEKNTQRYKGNRVLQGELRHLRSLALIEMRGDKHVGQITDDMKFDLGDFVQLTGFGRMWAERIQKIEKREVGQDAAEDGPAEGGGLIAVQGKQECPCFEGGLATS